MKKYHLLSIAFVLSLGLTLAACGRGGDPTPMPTPTALPAAEVATVAPTPTDEVAAEQPESPLQSESPLQPSTPLPTPTPEPEPEAFETDTSAGLAVVKGTVINPNTGEPVAGHYLRLAEVYCPEDVTEEEKETRCFWALDDAFSPFATSNEDGSFEFTDVLPFDYVFLVGDVKTTYALANNAEGKPIIFTILPDQGLDLKEIKVIYP